MGLRPGEEWAEPSRTAEVAGGALTALGLLFPTGPIIASAPKVVSWRKAHRDKPIWVNQGGAVLPLTNQTIAAVLMLAGPGPASIDHLLGIKTPWWLSLVTIIGTAGSRSR